MIVTGNFVVQTEAQAQAYPFKSCFPGCIVSCAIEKKFPTGLMCPFTCFLTCLPPPTSNIPSPPSQMILANEKIDHYSYFCKLGCATHHCLPLSSLQNPMMVMGNFVIQTQAQDTLSFRTCYPGCIDGCAIEKQLPKLLLCPFTCLFTCLSPPTSNIPSPPSQMILAKEIDHMDYFCKLGCATHHCASFSSVRKLNVDKVADCVDSCSNKCSNKN
ncbi:hypothetical protein Bca52824_032749 [Brassica carinata]|uniref:Thionin-like protein 2 n=1 Tax=Brassica carinata TaxID=52824 RepID=A0A8X7SDB3_BRACI|nr:hypothetical protein Bca52824_032749 [Brassica carinata]